MRKKKSKKKNTFLKKFNPLGLATLASIFLLTTSWEHYENHPLKSTTSSFLPAFSLGDAQLVVNAKAMTVAESKRSFGHDLLSRDVQPLQLTIENNTSNEYSLCASSVDLPRIEASRVAFKVTKSAIPRSIAYKIASLFFWPLAIPGAIDSIRTFTHHKNLKKDLKAKSLREETVAPYSVFHRVLFVPKDEFKETFKVTLIDLETLKPSEFMTTVVGKETPAEAIQQS